jgi:hypothetical protein
MELILSRVYKPEGTNGVLLHKGVKLCATIELPWHNNIRSVSCIPEGKYALSKRYSPKHKWHLQVMDVPGRRWILIHPANDALKELKGCIAPVTTATSSGHGSQSRRACDSLYQLAFAELDKRKPVYLTIKANDHA